MPRTAPSPGTLPISSGPSTSRCDPLQRRLAPSRAPAAKDLPADRELARRRSPLVLENAEPGFAVARGAALFGRLLDRKTERIEAGAAHAVFLEALEAPRRISRNGLDPRLVCVLPRGASPEATIRDHGCFRSKCIRIGLHASKPTIRTPSSQAKQATSSIGASAIFTPFRLWRRSSN